MALEWRCNGVTTVALQYRYNGATMALPKALRWRWNSATVGVAMALQWRYKIITTAKMPQVVEEAGEAVEAGLVMGLWWLGIGNLNFCNCSTASQRHWNAIVTPW